jgi:segregation and condensation protein B
LEKNGSAPDDTRAKDKGNGLASSKEDELQLDARVEALLFASPGPVSARDLAAALEVPSRLVLGALETLDQNLRARGLRIQKHGSQYQLVTAPDAARDVERLLNLEDTSRLSRAALEALAIVAYQQPVTRPQIDSIRGVNSDSVLRTLLRHGLIEESGRSMSPGRPILYSTTAEFLQNFGLSEITELPPLDPDLVTEAADATPQNEKEEG